MFRTIWHLAWFTILACTVAFVMLAVLGRLVFAQAAGEHDPVIVRDELGPSSHHLSGMINVPSPCDELQERVETISSTTYKIVFSTWREPSMPCSETEVPRAFRDALFAPATGVEFTALLDGAPVPILVLPVQPAGRSPVVVDQTSYIQPGGFSTSSFLTRSSLDARSPVISH